MFKKIIKKIDELNSSLEDTRMYEILALLQNKKQMFIRNLISGIGKGVGIGIGFYLITAILIYLLQYVVRLNIPVIGKYISDIVDIVDINRKQINRNGEKNEFS